MNPDAIEPEESNDINATNQAAKATTATTTAPEDQTIHGIYMDWSHNSEGFWAGARQRNTTDATQKDRFLAQLVTAASGAGESYLPNTSRSTTFMPQGLFPTNDPFDFPTPTRAQSPVTQIAVDPWKDPGFTITPDTFTRYPNNDDAMEDVVPTTSSLPWLESWPLFQCNPVIPSSACAPTGALHVKNLQALLKDGNIWMKKARSVESKTAVEPLLPSTREKLIAVLQALFNEAQQLYGLQDRVGSSVLVLPPPSELDSLFRAYVDYCESHYPFIPTASMKTNKLIEGRNTIISSMVLIMMLAAAAMTAGTGDACHQIAHGLVEICRTALRSRIDQNIKLMSDPGVLQCALLLTIVAVWSGDKWQMDVSLERKIFEWLL